MCIRSGNRHMHRHALCAHGGRYIPDCLLLRKRLLFVVGVEASTQVPVLRPAFPVASHAVGVALSWLSSEPV